MNRGYYDTRRPQTPRPAAAAPGHDPDGAEPPQAGAAGSLSAELIIALAREHHVLLQQDAGLIEALARLEIGSAVPAELYAVVAEVLAFVYALDADAAPG